MIRYIDFIDFISTALLNDFAQRGDIVVKLEHLKQLTYDIEEELPFVRVDYDDEIITRFKTIDKRGITITEKEIKIKRGSDGYVIVKRASEINRNRESMKHIIEIIAKKNNNGIR